MPMVIQYSFGTMWISKFKFLWYVCFERMQDVQERLRWMH